MGERPLLRVLALLVVVAGAAAFGGWWFTATHDRTEGDAAFAVEREPAVVRTESDVVTIGLRLCRTGVSAPTITAIRPTKTGDATTVGVATRLVGDTPMVVAAESFPPTDTSFLGLEWERFDGMFEVTGDCSDPHELIFGVDFGQGGTFGDIVVEYDLLGATYETVLAGRWVRCGPSSEGLEECAS